MCFACEIDLYQTVGLTRTIGMETELFETETYFERLYTTLPPVHIATPGDN